MTALMICIGTLGITIGLIAVSYQIKMLGNKLIICVSLQEKGVDAILSSKEAK